MKKILLLFVYILGFNQIISGQAKSLHSQIDHFFQDFLKDSPAPGFSVVVVKGDQVVFKRGYGIEKADGTKAMTAQSLIGIGSLTKSFTALALIKLVEQGKIQLDQPVIRYLPKFQTANKILSDKITVRMLLNNSSGLQGGVSQIWQDKGESLEHLMQSLQSFYLKRSPGSSYEYSNAAFSMAGLIISRVSGMSYPEFLKQHIFLPLAMKRSTTDPNDFKHLQVLYGHHMGLNNGIPAESGIESGEMIPAGSMLRSCATDLGHYLIALLNGGSYEGRQLISSQSITAMWTPQIQFPGLSYDKGGDGKDFHYGLGWMISEVEGRTLIHHGGSTGTMSSMTILLPKRQMAASILFNLDYNFVDRYRFQSEFSLLNNLFHLLENEEHSNFGDPRVPDPTLNDYTLPRSLQKRVSGTYQFTGKGDTRHFQGVSLDIFLGQNAQLEAQIKRGKTLLSHFRLDFTNEVNAVSRNIGAPQSIRFKVRPDGKVTAVYYAGTEFKKLQPGFLAKYQRLETSAFSFYFPKNWNWNFQKDSFNAYNETNPKIVIGGGQLNSTTLDLKAFIKQQFPQHSLLYEGLEISEARGRYFWRQQSFSSQDEKNSFQHLILLNEPTGFYLILTSPYGKLTKEIQPTLAFLMDSFGML